MRDSLFRSGGEPDVDSLRAETPGTTNVCHFNNAGAALVPQPVLDANKAYLDLEAAIGGYEAVERSTDALQRSYIAMAELLNCHADEIAIVQSATAAWSQVFLGLTFKPGDRVLTSVAEYGSNFLAFLQAEKRHGMSIEVIPEDEGGDISIPDLERMLCSGAAKPVLIAITHVPTSSGRVYDAAAVGAVARKHGILYLLDACQSVGQMPIDVAVIGCDFLTGTSRKYLRGPRGVGFLYASRKAMQMTEPAVVDVWGASWVSRTQYDLHATARRYESYEVSFAAKAGFGVAVAYTLELGQAWICKRIQSLAALLRQQLARVPGVSVHDQGRVLCGLVSFTKAGTTAVAIKMALQERRINVSVSAAPSTRLDMDARGLTEVVRASVHYYNTEQEVADLVAAVAAVMTPRSAGTELS
ncbi:hypothetical protein WJX72_006290 [[Myrmecia] bisecta]|uniref:Aminotransferase class V domain-containing protein n=1 Tax=[Myrmecia] bisecta TaxID=41462 RepID=A0AAW1QQZ3_9CHLO